MITTANINRIDRDTLASLLLSPPNVDALAIVDVRDSGITNDDRCSTISGHTKTDRYAGHVGGHIKTSTWVPSNTLDYRAAELVHNLKTKEKVVFHCALSQQRGPAAALRYARERDRILGPNDGQKQEVMVLDGGFTQ